MAEQWVDPGSECRQDSRRRWAGRGRGRKGGEGRKVSAYNQTGTGQDGQSTNLLAALASKPGGSPEGALSNGSLGIRANMPVASIWAYDIDIEARRLVVAYKIQSTEIHPLVWSSWD